MSFQNSEQRFLVNLGKFIVPDEYRPLDHVTHASSATMIMLLSRAFSLRSHGRKMPHSQWSLDFCVALLHLFKWVTDDDHDDECIQLCIYRYICASWYFPRLPGYLHWINNGLRVCLISLPSSPKRYLQMNIPRFIFPYVSLTHNFFPHYYLNFFRYSCTAYIFFWRLSCTQCSVE